MDVVRELKEMAAQVEVATPGGGYFDTSALGTLKHRLRVALDFYPGDLPRTTEAADPNDLTQARARAAVAPAAAELAEELRRLEDVRGLNVDWSEGSN